MDLVLCSPGALEPSFLRVGTAGAYVTEMPPQELEGGGGVVHRGTREVEWHLNWYLGTQREEIIIHTPPRMHLESH